MGALKRGGDGNVIYDESLVTEIHKVNVETCNLFFVEGLFLNLDYPGYNEVYWLEPGLNLAKGLRVLRTDAEVMRVCENAMKNDNIVRLYFDHPIDANPDIVDKDVVSDGSSENVYEINPPIDNVNEDKVTNKIVGETNERENEVVNEVTVEVNELNKGVSGVVNEIVNEVVNETTVEVNELNKGVSVVMNEDVNEVNGIKTLKWHQLQRRVLRGQAEGDSGQVDIVNEATHKNNVNDANDANEGANFGHPIRIVPGKDNEASRVEVSNPNREDGDSGSEMYQYEFEELCSSPGSDDEEEPVFPQHNPNTPHEKITLELNMEFETIDHFKAAM
ncbi:hypothetical protein Ahy_B01g056615 [Arachis hypogaea]|uniref:PB1-like domain-containing protein n=1 Tax=Arachis hypogaea TaxID=3818 RepID=A0A445AZ71_ARAHY|nr:hypothetical protein Ahy_B01g056615 [Arachis hypogaea]